jgi:hypothetical protein
MAVRIQIRRGNTNDWDTANPTLAAGEIGFDTQAKVFKVGTGTDTWSTLPGAANMGDISGVYASTGLSYGTSTTLNGTASAGQQGSTGEIYLKVDDAYVVTAGTFDAAGDLIVGTGSDTYGKLTKSASSNAVLTAGTSQLAWSTDLVQNSLVSPLEKWSVQGSAPSSTQAIYVNTASAWLYTTATSTGWIPNIAGSASVTLSSLLAVGQSITVSVAVTTGSSATSAYPSTLQIDGNAASTGANNITLKWQNALAPTSGNASSIDVYTYSIVKTAATSPPSYTVFASRTKFA